MIIPFCTTNERTYSMCTCCI